ncbi:MAG: hypothetical protein JWQ71_1371, partial [Pedosphaera sp.]|nr:hypothetical protein [Pedosphaera sp.]
FSYIVNDGNGGTANGTDTVNINGAANQPAQNIVSMNVLPNSHALLRFAGIPGRIYTIQASTNMITWTNLSAATAATNGTFQFEDADAASFPIRYYRTVYP